MNRRDLIATAAVLTAAAASPAFGQTRQRLRFAVTDVDGSENLQREFGPFKAAFERVMPNVEIALFPVSGRTSAVEAMNANQVDLVLTGPAEYVVFKARMPAVQPVVIWQRPDYFSQVVVLAEGPIKQLSDLKGKKISFGEIGSTSSISVRPRSWPMPASPMGATSKRCSCAAMWLSRRFAVATLPPSA